MKIDNKRIFFFIVILLLIAIGIWPTKGSNMEIASVEDGTTIITDEGVTVRLIGITNTQQGKQGLLNLVNRKIILQPDMSANFDPSLLKCGDVIYAYILLKDNMSCVNAQLLKDGKVGLSEGGHLVDSLKSFRSYALSVQGNIDYQEPQPVKPDPIDYKKDNIDLPNYTPDNERKHHQWYGEWGQNIDMLSEACDYNLPYTKMFANKLAGKSPGSFNMGQICEIFDYCYGNWKYVNDPQGQDYIAKASETIAGSLCGDCDDFAVLLSSCMLACGGNSTIVYADGDKGCHAYAMVDISPIVKNEGENEVARFISERYARYSPNNINYRKDGSHLWLNLDWQAAYPGGPFFGASTNVFFSCIDGKWSWKK